MDAASFILQAAIALALVGILSAATAFALSRCLRRNDDADSLFWYGFSGLLAVVFVIIGAVATVPGSGGLVSAGALVFAGVAMGWLWRGERERRRRVLAEEIREVREGLRTRHERVLQQWVTYELDPAAAIDFPAMTDLSRSDTSQLIRSMRAAALMREQFEGDDVDSSEYERAVAGLEAALRAAETAAGVIRTDPMGRELPATGKSI
ncbi:hypothetical protein ACX80Z_09665 [Arthrobacter sp. TMT4-20]|uniref:hypothetical protein n=1 Tax=Arthrobacter sp. TB 23 TaxID=494419 RepID=UPI0002F13918|nr:hypothetical protein [Arthrobacter sp. TB 23]